MSSLVGLIGLFGIAVQNSLVLVTQMHGLQAAGYSVRDAVREASIGRVRPKLMTAGAAIVGLLPILILQLTGASVKPLPFGGIGQNWILGRNWPSYAAWYSRTLTDTRSACARSNATWSCSVTAAPM